MIKNEINQNRIKRQQPIYFCHNGRRIISQQSHIPLPWLNHVTEAHPYAEYAMLDKSIAYKRELVGISEEKLNLEWICLCKNRLEYNILTTIIDRIRIRHPFQEIIRTPRSSSPTFNSPNLLPQTPDSQQSALSPAPTNKKRHIEFS